MDIKEENIQRVDNKPASIYSIFVFAIVFFVCYMFYPQISMLVPFLGENVTVKTTIQTDSVDTNNADRDTHLKSEEFFNAAAHPTITFETNSLNNDVSGNLTINGVTKPIQLDGEFGGINVDPWGQTKAGFSFEGKIKRSDFGLNWNAALEAGGVMVSDDVRIYGELQFVKA